VVIVATPLRTRKDTRAAERFNVLLGNRVVIDLPETFAADDADAAGAKLIAEVQRLIGNRV
jgi:hypothetical protein